MRALGADQVIDYNAEDFTAIGSICDLVFDTVGGGVRAGSYAVARITSISGANKVRSLLPDLLPNSVARGGTRADDGPATARKTRHSGS